MVTASRLREILGERLFDFPSERLIAAGRVLLVLFALAAEMAAGPPGGATQAILGGYLLFALVHGAFVLRRLPTFGEQVFAHMFDIVAVSALIASTDSQASPFFVFFLFILLASTIRWNWRGALATALLLIGLYAALAAVVEFQPSTLTRVVNRASVLLVGSALLAYVGAYRERSLRRLAQLASWPGPDRSSGAAPPIAAALKHAADLVRAPRVVLIWEQPEEPFRHVAVLAEGEVRQGRAAADRFGTLVDPSHVARSFLLDVPEAGARGAAHLVDPDLCATFAIRKVLSAPFHRDLCQGRIFALDPASASDDNLLLIKLIAERMGVDLEHYLLRQEAQSVTALRERERLGRDLHDGLLQSLAAANIRLKLCASGAPMELQAQLEETRGLLADEQQRIRHFVTDHRPPLSPEAEIAVRDSVAPRLRDLGRHLRCEVGLEVSPADLRVPAVLARHVRHLVGEAVSNAARHGPADRVQVAIARIDDAIAISVGDSGGGFRGLCGTYEDEDLRTLGLGPASLHARVAELGGRLRLETSPTGSRIDVRLPL